MSFEPDDEPHNRQQQGQRPLLRHHEPKLLAHRYENQPGVKDANAPMILMHGAVGAVVGQPILDQVEKNPVVMWGIGEVVQRNITTLMLQRTALISLLLLVACNAEQLPNQRMFVQSIASGNTLVMVGKGQEYKVTLCGVQVSADQEAQAKKLLQSLLTQQAEERGVSISISRSKGSELTAEVFAPTANPDEEKILNGELLAAGLARATSEDCPNREAFQAIEADAKERRVGIWNQHFR